MVALRYATVQQTVEHALDSALLLILFTSRTRQPLHHVS